MSLLRLVFGLRTIYFSQTVIQILYQYFIAIGVLWIITANTNMPMYVLVPAYVLTGYGLLRTTLRTFLVRKYLKQYPESLFVMPAAEMQATSISAELDTIDQLKPIAAYGDARLFLATFDFYRQTKRGQYLAKQAYYTVLEVQLIRRLPHVLFDSKATKKRQFKSLYLKTQRISVQGPFDDVFDTYVPQTYTIDTLSFISPEVMEVLVQASMYDIEIIGNKVYLYAPLLSKEEFESLLTKGNTIARELNDNIDTYRDDRLEGSERATDVTFFARALLRSPLKYLTAAGGLALMIAAVITAAVVLPAYRGDILWNQVTIVLYCIFVVDIVKAISILRSNKKALKNYEVLYQTDRGKPTKNSII